MQILDYEVFSLDIIKRNNPTFNEHEFKNQNVCFSIDYNGKERLFTFDEKC